DIADAATLAEAVYEGGSLRSGAWRKRRIHGKPLNEASVMREVCRSVEERGAPPTRLLTALCKGAYRTRAIPANSVGDQNCYSIDGPVGVVDAGARIWYSAGGSAPSKCFTK